jgi:hypothetical protein
MAQSKKVEISPESEFHEVIDLLISLNLTLRDEDTRHALPLVQWLKECCTVHCNIGRRSGKTNYIKSRATINDIVIVHNHQMKKYLLNETFRVFEPNELRRKDMAWDMFSGIVFVDEPALVFKEIGRDLLYEILSVKHPKLFLMLGE